MTPDTARIKDNYIWGKVKTNQVGLLRRNGLRISYFSSILVVISKKYLKENFTESKVHIICQVTY